MSLICLAAAEFESTSVAATRRIMWWEAAARADADPGLRLQSGDDDCPEDQRAGEPRRRRGRGVAVAGDRAGPDRAIREGDRGLPVDPPGSGAGQAIAVRRHDRARVLDLVDAAEADRDGV